MSKAAFLCMVFLATNLLSGCKKEPNNSGSDDNNTTTTNTTGSKLVDKVIDASVQDVTVSVQGKINVVVPKGMAPANSTITIEKIDAAGLPKDDKFTIMDVYEVKLSSGSSFSTPLRVTINYDASKAPTGKFRNKMGAAYLDETAKVWRVFADCVVDTINKTMTFPTNHLTKLSTWGWTSTTSVYTDYYSTSHFNIYWQAGKIYTNTEYKTPLPTAGSNPDYIKDIGKYMEDSYNAYRQLGLTVPTLVKVDVYLTSTLEKGVDGQSSFFGYIFLNNKISGDGSISIEKMVPMVCAHEFLHYVQDYYYMQLGADFTIKWWLEATATQADRMVGSSGPNFESLLYGDKVTGILEKSWDDCNADPDWYTAGCFLAYLSAYRTGSKANIAELIKLGGANTSISYIRTMIDTYLKNNLSAAGIGTEYANYMKWAFEKKGQIQIISTLPSQKNGNSPYVLPVYVPLIETTTNVKSTFPHLSVRTIKIYHDKNVDAKAEQDKEITITAKSIPAEVTAYIYKMSNPTGTNPVTYYQGLKTNDIVKLTLPKGGIDWIEILLVNTSKDDAKSIDIDVKSKVPDDILTLLKKANSVYVTVQAKHNQGNVSGLGNDYMGLSYTSADAKPYPPLSWSSTSFSSSVVDAHKPGYSFEVSRSVTGTFSPDGKILTSIASKQVGNTYADNGVLSKVETTEITLANLPYYGELPLSYIAGYGVSGANSSSYVTKLVYSLKTLNTTGTSPVWVTSKSYSSTTYNADSRVNVQFSNN